MPGVFCLGRAIARRLGVIAGCHDRQRSGCFFLEEAGQGSSLGGPCGTAPYLVRSSTR